MARRRRPGGRVNLESQSEYLPGSVVSGSAVFGNAATVSDQNALYANANADPYEAAWAATNRNETGKGSLGALGAVLATVDAVGMPHVGVQASVDMNGKRGWAFGVASTIRGDEDYSAGEEGLWGAEFDICVLGTDAGHKYSGVPQSTHGLLVASGSLRKPQYGFELFAGKGGSTTTTAAGNVSDATIPLASMASIDSRRGYVTITKADASIALVRYTGVAALNLTGCTLISGGAGAFSSGAVVYQQWAPFQYGLAFLYDRTSAVAEAGTTILDEAQSATHVAWDSHLRDDGDSIYQWTAAGTHRWAPGEATGPFDTELGRSGVGILALTGSLHVRDNLHITQVGGGLGVKEGTNAKMGTVTLVGGNATVNTTAVTANSRIFLTTQSPGGSVGVAFVASRVPGTSFAISNSSGADTSTLAWLIVEPT